MSVTNDYRRLLLMNFFLAMPGRWGNTRAHLLQEVEAYSPKEVYISIFEGRHDGRVWDFISVLKWKKQLRDRYRQIITLLVAIDREADASGTGRNGDKEQHYENESLFLSDVWCLLSHLQNFTKMCQYGMWLLKITVHCPLFCFSFPFLFLWDSCSVVSPSGSAFVNFRLL
jgi:hypothetical protein